MIIFSEKYTIKMLGINDNQIVLFQSQDGSIHLEVNKDGNSVWLRQEQIAQLFGKDVSGVSRHISKIF